MQQFENIKAIVYKKWKKELLTQDKTDIQSIFSFIDAGFNRLTKLCV